MLKSPKGRKAKLTRATKRSITITTMGEVIDRYLRPSHNIGLYSIGSDLVYHPYGPEHTAGGLRELRSSTIKLRSSEHINDQDAVRNINNMFVQYDHTMATRNLNHRLREPIGKDILEWVSHAPDEDVESFCKWSLVRTHHLTQALRRDQPDFINNTLDRASKLVSIGLFPSMALPVIDAATQRYQIQGMDSFYRGGMNAVGFCGSDTIAMANRYKSPKYMYFATTGMKKTMFHEYIHGAGNDRGFFWGIKTAMPVARILEEAFVEHSSVVAFGPSMAKKPFIIDPAKRIGSWALNGTYRPERTFMATLVEHTDITLEHLSEAYFRPRGDERGEWLREDIERKIGRFFGSRQEFFGFMNEYEESSRSNRPTLVQNKVKDLTKPSNA